MNLIWIWSWVTRLQFCENEKEHTLQSSCFYASSRRTMLHQCHHVIGSWHSDLAQNLLIQKRYVTFLNKLEEAKWVYTETMFYVRYEKNLKSMSLTARQRQNSGRWRGRSSRSQELYKLILSNIFLGLCCCIYSLGKLFHSYGF